MKNRYIQNFEKSQIGDKKIPPFRAGDTIDVAVRIKEGNKSRVQHFEGLCISIRGNGVDRTFTIRKISVNSVGVERIFPIYSKSIEGIRVVKRGRVRRAKLYYMRGRLGKAARIKELRKINNKRSDKKMSDTNKAQEHAKENSIATNNPQSDSTDTPENKPQ